MARARSSHEQKTLDERQIYLNTAVRHKPTPTVDEPVAGIDSTDTTVAPGLERTPSYGRTRTRRRRRFVWLRENWVPTSLVALFIAVAGWIGHEVYSLNREVGELRIQVAGTAKEQDESKGDLERLGEQMRREMDRINERLDHILRGR